MADKKDPTPPQPTQPVAVNPDTNVFLEGASEPTPYPEAKDRPRVAFIGGVRCEHVSTTADGVWVYRPM